jgi:aromatic-L-amino-acid decarboxylase
MPTAPAPVTDLAWSSDRARALGNEMVELWGELLDRLPSLSVGSRRTAEEVRASVARDVPDEPLAVDELVAYLRDLTFNNATLTGHPGFMAYISGSGTIPGAAVDLLASALNQNLGGWRLSPGATEIEQHLMRWFAERLGFPSSAGGGGLVTSGGAMAAFIALKAARDANAGWDVRRAGIAAGPPLTMYASAEVHDVNLRAADMLGLGADAVRLIPLDGELRMRVDALRDAVAADLRDGRRPIAVVATAGTVSTGAIDPMDEIADLCAEHGLWMHVDGAYGGVAALTSALRDRFPGIQRAESIAFDPHKWLYTPHSGGALVVRDVQRLANAFAIHPTYTHEDKELTGRGGDMYELGPQFSRGFSALKIWMSLLAHGWSAYERRIAHDVALARYLYDCVRAHPELEPMGPEPTLSIACFRYVPPELRETSGADERIDAINERLMFELQLEGRAYPSNAIIGGRFAIRACIVNFRTEATDIDALVSDAVVLGRRIHAAM